MWSKIVKVELILLSKGDVEEAKRMLGALPYSPYVDSLKININLYERDYKKALEQLESIDFDTHLEQIFYFNKDLFYARIYHFQNQPTHAKTHTEQAREDIENKIREYPKDWRFYDALGLAYAYLGLKEEAIREGKRAVEILPITKDALEGIHPIENLARIYVLCGENEEAINQIEYLLSIPAGFIISIQSLQLDPIWDPLHQHPRFQQLLKKHSTS